MIRAVRVESGVGEYGGGAEPTYMRLEVFFGE